MERIAIIGSGVIAKVIAERARELNVESHCFSYNKNDLASAAVDYFHEVDIFDVCQIIDICKKNNITGVIATTELTILPAARIAEELGLNGNPINAAEEITNKYLVRNKVKHVNDLKQPNFWVYTDGEIPEINCFPVIVKPIAAGGKRGVQVINSVEELRLAIVNALPYSKVKGVLIEEYIAGGMEYSVESLSYHGCNYIIQITQKDSSGPPRCNELGHHQPAELSADMRAKVEYVLSDALTAAGIKNGPCHTEIKILDDEVYLIEINGRPGGDHITYPLTELSTGYPFVSAIIWIALDQFDGREPRKLESNFCGVCFVTEETAYLKPLFDKCEQYSWFYKKNKVSDKPSKIVFNDGENLNYFIYFDRDKRPDFTKII